MKSKKAKGHALFEKLKSEVENSFGADVLGTNLEDFSSNELQELKDYLSTNVTEPFFVHNKQVSKTQLVCYIDRHLAIKKFRLQCNRYNDDYVKAFSELSRGELKLLNGWIDEKVSRLTLAYRNSCDNFNVRKMENILASLSSYEKAKEALVSMFKV